MDDGNDEISAQQVGCLLVIVAVLVVFVMIGLDKQNSSEIRDLQRRIAVLEQRGR